MPRMSDHDFLRTHHRLKRWWQTSNVYGYLTPAEQWDLHRYFQPSKDLTDQELLEHRRAVTKDRPGLALRAGKALTKFDQRAEVLAAQRAEAAALPATRARAKQRDRQLQVHAVVRPEPDTRRLAQALIAQVLDETKKQSGGGSDIGPQR